MALSGVIENSIVSGKYTLRLNWTATQSVANNTSTVTVKAYLVQAASYSLNIGSRASNYNSLTVGGTTKNYTSPAINNSGGATTLLASEVFTFSHNADGTASVTLAGVFGIRATITGTYYSQIAASGTITLDTIRRVSVVTASSSDVTIGNAVTINTNRYSSVYTHTLRYSIGSASGTIANNVTASYAWTIPMSQCNNVPSSTSGAMTIYCDTYNGNTKIGTSAVTITVRVPSSVVPSVTGCTIAEAASGIPSGWNLYVSGLSQLRLSASASGSYSSTIKAYSIEANGVKYEQQTATTGVLVGSGSKSITVSVTDSRGRKATRSFSYTLYAYSRPAISSFTAKRVNSQGYDDDNGTYAKISCVGSISSVNNRNSGTLVIQYRAKDTASWTTAGTYNVATTISQTVTVSNVSIDKSYIFMATLTDAMNTATISDEIATAAPTVDFKANGRGVAFGKVSEYDAFECAFPARLTGGLYVGGGVNADHLAGCDVNAMAGNYYKLFSFPMNRSTGWNTAGFVLSVEETTFGDFAGNLDCHVRNSTSAGTVNQKVLALRNYRGSKAHGRFYINTDSNVCTVYWYCNKDYQTMRVRVLNGYMPNATFDRITWDGSTSSSTITGATECDYYGVYTASGIWQCVKHGDGRMEAWGAYSVSNAACTTAIGVMYRTDTITPTAFPVAFSAVPNVQYTFKTSGTSALPWVIAAGNASNPPNLYLVRPATGTVSGTLNIYAAGLWR